MNHPRLSPPTPLAGMEGFRTLVMGIPELRDAAAALVGGELGKIWLVVAAGGMMMLSTLARNRKGIDLDPVAVAIVENSQYTMSMALLHSGVDVEAFYKGLPEFLTSVRERTDAHIQTTQH
ncbi:MAG TPA: hypothetical protein VF077_11695 [Nitrospiraceae bacterium]